jgi:hypothetical protein
MPKTKSKKQVGYLLSNDSPLSGAQQDTLKSELSSGEVKVKKDPPMTLDKLKAKAKNIKGRY